MTYVSACTTAEVAPGTMKGVDIAGQGILLANVDGSFFAIQRKCPHMGFDLCKGMLAGATVTCRMHGATFDLATGEAVQKAKLLFLKTQPKPARTFPVRLDGGSVTIDV